MPAATLAEIPSPEQVEAQIEKLFEGQPRGFPFGDFEVDDIMLPDGDDMDIPSDDDDAADEEEIQAESGFGSVIGAAPSRPPHSLFRPSDLGMWPWVSDGHAFSRLCPSTCSQPPWHGSVE
jgi:hypothetical protein